MNERWFAHWKTDGADLLVERRDQSGDVRPGVAAAEAHAPRGRDVALRRAVDEVRVWRLRRVVEEERPLAVGGADDGPGFGREELRRVHAVRRGGPVQRGVVAPQVVAGRLQRKGPPPPECDGALEPLAALVPRVVLRAEAWVQNRRVGRGDGVKCDSRAAPRQ